MGAQRSQKGRDLLAWIMAHPDKPLTVEAMAAATDWNTNSASSTAARLVTQYPDNLRRSSKGTYVWSSKPLSAEDQPVKELLLRVIKHRADGAMLAENLDNTDELYVVTPFDF